MTTPEAKDDTTAAPSNTQETVDAVAERLRFFFSDANIRQDFFVRNLLMSEAAAVPVETLLRFNTIKQHTLDPAVVVQAAKKLPEQLTVTPDDKAIGRVQAFTMDQMNENVPLSLYVSKIPVQGEGKDRQYSVKSDDIRKLLEEYGGIAIVKLRYQRASHGKDEDEDDDDIQPQTGDDNNNKSPRKPKRRYPLGAALVEFETTEAMEKAAEQVLTRKAGEAVEPKRKLLVKVGDTETQLDVQTLQDYIDARKNHLRSPKNKRDRQQTPEGGDETVVPKDIKFEFDWKPGCVVRLEGLTSVCDREAILEAVAKGLDISEDEVKNRKIYADYSRGQENGAIRFAETSAQVQELATKLGDHTVTVGDCKVAKAFVLEGEEETKYWNDFIDFKTKQMRHRAEERVSRKKQRRYRN